MQMGDAKVLAPTRSFWVGALYPAETKEKTGKDMVMTCRAVAVVAGQAAAATADAGPGTDQKKRASFDRERGAT
jgi:hypothetical protein